MRVTLPLASLSGEAAQLAAAHACCLAASVVVPADGMVYEFQGSMTFPLLSVAKVPIMLSLLERVRAEGRQLTPYESRLLDQMIRASDNDAASALWKAAGGTAGIEALLQSAGMAPMDTGRESWGDILASPTYMATLMGKLVQGEVLDEPGRAIARRLLETVADSQNWGAAAGAEGATTGVKNGWYRDREGAMIHSLAYVVPPPGTPAYAIAVFTRGNVSPLAGIKLIEQLSAIVNAAMAARR